MRNALVIRHVAFEDLGLLADIIKHFDYQIRYLDAGRDEFTQETLTTADLLIVLGGPISANDEANYPFLTIERQAVAERIAADGATLGLCLGAQIIARALHANVNPGPAKEIGWSSLTLTTQGKDSCLRHLMEQPVLHWHGETCELPPAAEHLASTEVCSNQAFRIGNQILALQFHPEVTADDLESWYIGHTLELESAGIDIPTLRQQSHEYAPPLAAAAARLFTEWLNHIR